MVIQSIPRSGGAAGFGAAVGEQAGKGISGSLQALIEHKTQEMTKQQARKNLQSAFPDIPQGALNFLSGLPPKEQMEYLQGLGEQERSQQQGQSQQQESPFSVESVTPEQKEQIKQVLSGPDAKQLKPEDIEKLQRFLSTPGKPQAPKPEQGLKLSQLPAKKSNEILDIKKEAAQDKRQLAIEKRNEQFNKPLDTFRDQAIEIVKDADEALNLVDSGKVEFGLLGSFKDKIPFGTTLMNDETQQFVSIVNDLVDKDSGFTKGVATNFKIKLKQAAKAHLGQSAETAKKVLERIKKEKSKLLDLAAARDQIVEENEGVEPKNLGQLARNRFEQMQNNAPEFPDDARKGDVYEDDFGQKWQYDGKGKGKKV